MYEYTADTTEKKEDEQHLVVFLFCCRRLGDPALTAVLVLGRPIFCHALIWLQCKSRISNAFEIARICYICAIFTSIQEDMLDISTSNYGLDKFDKEYNSAASISTFVHIVVMGTPSPS
jgi:hypothetical protein